MEYSKFAEPGEHQERAHKKAPRLEPGALIRKIYGLRMHRFRFGRLGWLRRVILILPSVVVIGDSQ